MQTINVKVDLIKAKLLEVKGVSAHRVALFLSYLIHRGADREYVPISYLEISKELFLSPKTINLIKETLKGKRILEVKEGRPGGGRFRSPTLWRVNTELLSQLGFNDSSRVAGLYINGFELEVQKIGEDFVIVKNGEQVAIFRDINDALYHFNKECMEAING